MVCFCLPEQIEIISEVLGSYGRSTFLPSSYVYQQVQFVIRAIHFDNYQEHAARLQNDHLAAISEVWNKLVSNLRRFYVSEDTLTVDEQLVGYQGTISGHTYIPSKPCKYGIKIFWFCKAKSGFPLSANIHVGKVSNEVHQKLGKDVVLELCQPYNGSGWDVVTDNFFTCHSFGGGSIKGKPQASWNNSLQSKRYFN